MDSVRRNSVQSSRPQRSVAGRDIIVPARPVRRVADDVAPPKTAPVDQPVAMKRLNTIPVGAMDSVNKNEKRVHRALAVAARRHGLLAKNTAKQSTVRRENKASKRRASRLKAFFGTRLFRYGLAAVITVATVGVGIDVWHTNTLLKEDLSRTVSALGSPNSEARQSNEGHDETPVPTQKIDTYRVAPSLPQEISIPALKLRARVLSMDINPDNSIQAPINIYDTGWYTGSAKPGEPGAALIDGHASGALRKGIFAYLDTMKVGNEITVTRGDGQMFVYRVVATDIVKKEAVDVAKLLRPYGDSPQGLNLITCTGEYQKDQKTYDQRAIVYSVLVRQQQPGV